MNLPEELLDEIFSYLPPGDRRSSESCSFVSKSWLEPSRRLLSAQISVGFSNYQSQLKNVQPTNTALPRHTRSLLYFTQPLDHGRGRNVYTLRDYLPSFCQPQALIFSSMVIETNIYENLGLFSSFQHPLSSLPLDPVLIAWSAFVALVGSILSVGG